MQKIEGVVLPRTAHQTRYTPMQFQKWPGNEASSSQIESICTCTCKGLDMQCRLAAAKYNQQARAFALVASVPGSLKFGTEAITLEADASSDRLLYSPLTIMTL